MVTSMRLAADERHDLADLLETLTPDQWLHPSLCEGWSVKDVVAHVISYEEISHLGVFSTLVRSGLRPGRLNEARLRTYRGCAPEHLVELLRAHLSPHGITAGFGGRIGLTDCMIHHQDIRRAPHLPRAIPSDRLRDALDFSLRAPVLPSRRNAAGLRAVATDLDWHHGDGLEIRGPGEALLMALAGRVDALGDLHGAGVEKLAGRVRP